MPQEIDHLFQINREYGMKNERTKIDTHSHSVQYEQSL